MQTRSLFISAQEVNAGTLFASMGIMEILKRKLHRVAFFRPVISTAGSKDGDIEFMLEHYKLDMQYEECYGFDLAYVEEMIAQDRVKELINALIGKFKKLERV